jgi:cobaltochelatase CobN
VHLLVKERRSLDEADQAQDLGQTPADLVLLSFFDADLSAAAQSWSDWDRQTAGERAPSLRLASLQRLRHPMSVDLYAEQVVARSRAVVARVYGGLDYWPYGAEQLSAICRAQGIPLALVAGDSGGRLDARLAALSTAPEAALQALDGYLHEGGPENLGQALRLAASLAGLCPPPTIAPQPMPDAGVFELSLKPTLLLPCEAGEVARPKAVTEGACAADAPATTLRVVPLPRFAGEEKGAVGQPSGDLVSFQAAPDDARPLASLVVYRSHYASGDVAPVQALAQALEARGMRTEALYASSLKSPTAAAFIVDRLARSKPAVVMNLTGFSARGPTGSPLDAAGAPVLQVALAGAAEAGWRASTRGLSPSDLAMQIALPELDGRLFTTAVAFKTQGGAIDDVEYARVMFEPEPDQIALAADRAAGWARLATTPRAERRLAVVLSNYPGAQPSPGQVGQAIGLDTFASLDAICADLSEAGYDIDDPAPSQRLKDLAPTPILSLAAYAELFAALPTTLRARIEAAWGPPEADSAVSDGAFQLATWRSGGLTVMLQPDRGAHADRKATYHDPDLPPRHAYVAAYLWLTAREDIHALVHLGAHGTLEWLPGKALAPAPDCAPVALMRGTPVIYPYIVNNPGEAAAAKRRLGAATIGHLTPPLRSAGVQGEAALIERLIDDYAAADGLDARRTTLLRREILQRAEATGLLAESGVDQVEDEEGALARLDAYLCDVKDLQIRDGLHVFGRPPTPDARDALTAAVCAAAPQSDPVDIGQALDACAAAERTALIVALDGRFVSPGPAGAPSRGRPDVLPTGRNLYAIDPRAVPTRAAMTLARRAAIALLQRHLEDQGEWPRRLVLDLWGGPTLRTGGEDLALALILMGVEPVWDQGSNRVTGIEVLPLAVLDRPRVDVTLRISGLFRDAFETQIALFDLAVRSVAARDEPVEDNPLAEAVRGLGGEALRGATARIYGPAPSAYGAGVEDLAARTHELDRAALGAAYLDAGGYAYGQDLDGRRDTEGFAARVGGADALVHAQDHAEVDLLDGLDFVASEGGFAAAAHGLGAAPALHHLDTSKPQAPRVRAVSEEVARVVRGRAANPVWIAGMMRHGYRGAAEIARTVEALHGFAATLPQRFDRQFDLLFAATLADPEVDAFLAQANPDARRALAARLAAARAQDLWRSRRNDIAAVLEAVR